MPATVDPLLPLSFLEAVRAVDRPDHDPDAEFVAELRNKRLGLSETVQAQIRRYRDAARRRQRPAADEVAGLARLIGRRPDAEVVFRAAGCLLGERAYAALPGTTRRVVRALPAPAARPLALQQLRRIARRYLGGTVRRDGAAVVLEVPAPFDGPAAAYYEAVFGELVGRLMGGPGRRAEPVPRADGGAGRRWRVEWAAAPASTSRSTS